MLMCEKDWKWVGTWRLLTKELLAFANSEPGQELDKAAMNGDDSFISPKLMHETVNKLYVSALEQYYLCTWEAWEGAKG